MTKFIYTVENIDSINYYNAVQVSDWTLFANPVASLLELGGRYVCEIDDCGNVTHAEYFAKSDDQMAAAFEAMRELGDSGSRCGMGPEAIAYCDRLRAVIKDGWCSQVKAEALRLGFSEGWKP